MNRKNITFSADEGLIESARKIAQRENRSLNDPFREWLFQYQDRNTASTDYQELMKRLSHVESGRAFTRNSMNER